jgi:hypothetical protein
MAGWVLSAGCTSADVPSETGGDAGDCFGCEDATTEADLASLVQSELGRTCTGAAGETYCHLLGAGGMFLTAGGDNFPEVINVQSTEAPSMVRVRPGSTAQSYLYLKLVGDGGIEGGRMPLSAPYNPALVELFADWIEAGALEH